MKCFSIFLPLVLASLLLAPLPAFAQSSFSLTPETVLATKPKTNFVMYNYAQFENLSGDTLAMRWVKTSVVNNEPGGHGGSAELGDWDISVQDPSTWHNPANDLDSADFVLPTVAGTTDKFILQLYPNGQAGTLEVKFRIFPINDPADSLILTFKYTVTDVVSAVQGQEQSPPIEVFPNPASDFLMLKNTATEPVEVAFVSAKGSLQAVLRLSPNEVRRLDFKGWSKGLWWAIVGNRALRILKV